MTTVGGRVIVDDGSPMPSMVLGFVGSGGTVNAMVSRDGSFSIQLPEGDKRVVVSGLPASTRSSLSLWVQAISFGSL
jgi:hypothetical protein